MGYDGHGQRLVNSPGEVMAGLRELESSECVLEQFANYSYELSVIVARDIEGRTETYPAIENRHQGGILRKSLCPSVHITPEVEAAAKNIALTIAEKIHLVGIMAVENFVMKNGDLLVNELAPRPHNSGHGTMDACQVNQFDQHIRTIAGLPVEKAGQHSGWVMGNILGDILPNLASYPDALVYDYKKKEIRPKRKMGHVTRVFPLRARAIAA